MNSKSMEEQGSSPTVSRELSQQFALEKFSLGKEVSETKNKKVVEDEAAWVREAVANPWNWVRNHTKTYNEHWHVEGRPSPLEPFPDEEYFPYIFDTIDLARITWFEKSRDMMLSWACVAYLNTARHKDAVLRRAVPDPKGYQA
jgi:hypothetical protein